jgi:hypothetical protein
MEHNQVLKNVKISSNCQRRFVVIAFHFSHVDGIECSMVVVLVKTAISDCMNASNPYEWR